MPRTRPERLYAPQDEIEYLRGLVRGGRYRDIEQMKVLRVSIENLHRRKMPGWTKLDKAKAIYEGEKLFAICRQRLLERDTEV